MFTLKDGVFTRSTANPVEISVVDNPCVPGAHFTAVKSDGSSEVRKFSSTHRHVAQPPSVVHSSIPSETATSRADSVLKIGARHSKETLAHLAAVHSALEKMAECHKDASAHLAELLQGTGKWLDPGGFQRAVGCCSGGFGTQEGSSGGSHTGTGLADWAFLYAHIVTATGWTYREIDELTLWEAHELLEYWREYPPLHVSVAAYLMAVKKPSTSKLSPNAPASTFQELKQMVVSAGGAVHCSLPAIYRNHQ